MINKSYRNTLEIAQYAAGLIGLDGISFLERRGKEVAEHSFSGPDELLRAVAAELSEDYETAAILTMTEGEAYDMYRLIKESVRKKGIPLHYIDRNSTAFEKGLTVTTYYLAKGLEFDQVFTAFPEKEHPYLKQASYISATRALHELYMYRIR